jgi:hypothetical protein
MNGFNACRTSLRLAPDRLASQVAGANSSILGGKRHDKSDPPMLKVSEKQITPFSDGQHSG